jgi:hypothetical protein
MEEAAAFSGGVLRSSTSDSGQLTRFIFPMHTVIIAEGCVDRAPVERNYQALDSGRGDEVHKNDEKVAIRFDAGVGESGGDVTMHPCSTEADTTVAAPSIIREFPDAPFNRACKPHSVSATGR